MEKANNTAVSLYRDGTRHVTRLSGFVMQIVVSLLFWLQLFFAYRNDCVQVNVMGFDPQNVI